MIDSIHISANGMQSQQSLVETISNNIANINTPSYKASRVEFSEMVNRGTEQDMEVKQVSGVAVSGLLRDFSVGELIPTQGKLDSAIVGSGFFEFVNDRGDLFYGRNGSFRVDKDGFLATQNGMAISSLIQLPSDYTDIIIDESGEVFVSVPDREQPLSVGKIEISHFVNPDGLESIGDGLYQTTDASGEAIVHSEQPSQLVQGFIEGSNVDMITELSSLVLAQKAYGLNSRLLQASDEILGLINDLRR